ncbi:FtsX-like permease family protein [Phyllobacterium sp. 22552]|uniref:FtsX-like permease family protein n=1 Tax=Phyllobacterium sp. 22552 TaxID=3453941 RepID=UPI003F87A89A
MTRLFQFLFRRIPVGWLQLTHNRARLMAAVAGIAFANLLVFVQLGVVASMTSTIQTTYTPFRADLIISPRRPQLVNGQVVSRRVMYMALADPAVADATPLFLGNVDWKLPDGASKGLIVYGVKPEAVAFAGETVRNQLAMLAPSGRALIDSEITGVEQLANTEALERISPETPMTFEIDGHAVSAVGSFRLGSDFGSDGGLFVSDQTFQLLVRQRTTGTPSHILVDVKPGENAAAVAHRLDQRLAPEQVQVRTMAEAVADELDYMNTEAPMGIIFGIGVFIGGFVGLVIVYQVLASDVAAHIKEYATFKAMGYPHRFLLGIVFEEALIIAFMGFVPGVALGHGVYVIMGEATGLPLGMTSGRALTVLAGTFIACVLSGALATLRLRKAEPADLF